MRRADAPRNNVPLARVMRSRIDSIKLTTWDVRGQEGSRGTWGFTPLVPRVALPGGDGSGSPETLRQAEIPFRPARYTKFGR